VRLRPQHRPRRFRSFPFFSDRWLKPGSDPGGRRSQARALKPQRSRRRGCGGAPVASGGFVLPFFFADRWLKPGATLGGGDRGRERVRWSLRWSLGAIVDVGLGWSQKKLSRSPWFWQR
jgi:hypothetical protein